MTREELIDAIVESAWSEKNLPTYHKAKRGLAARNQRQRARLKSTERAVAKSPRLQKVYHKGLKGAKTRGRRGTTAFGATVGAVLGAPAGPAGMAAGAAIGGAAGNLGARAEHRFSKASKRSAHGTALADVRRHQKRRS